jgi:carotenoid 1,2-hydratase
VDAQSDEGRYALTVIAFIGSVFSPYYAWARRGDAQAPAEQHNAINVVLKGPSGSAWSMTERGSAALERTAHFLRIGPSDITWRNGTLVIRLNEIGFPWPARIRGEIRLYPQSLPALSCPLDRRALHWWHALAPVARVEVDLQAPRQRWSGAAYFDSNCGAGPLEQAFTGWHWSRTRQDSGAAVLYDVERSDGTRLELALHIAANGRVERFEPPPLRALAPSAWRLARFTRCEAGAGAQVARTLLDAPFYVRSEIVTQLAGSRARGIHESLSLRRFSSRWIQAMLAMRMPRRSHPN